MTRTVSGLFVYPVKGCRGTALQQAALGPRGIRFDREWMVVDPDGHFLTQREVPALALVVPGLSEETLTLATPGGGSVAVSLDLPGANRPVVVWDSVCQAVDQGDKVGELLSDYLERPVRLVRMAPEHVRSVDPDYATGPGDQVGFADGYPLLLTTEASLADLNDKMAAPLPMNRFRPNVVVRGGQPWEEDGWGQFRIGDQVMTVAKPCSRCAVTQNDQETLARGKEPLATLARIRFIGGKMLFGVNVIHAGPGVLKIGDGVVL